MIFYQFFKEIDIWRTSRGCTWTYFRLYVHQTHYTSLQFIISLMTTLNIYWRHWTLCKTQIPMRPHEWTLLNDGLTITYFRLFDQLYVDHDTMMLIPRGGPSHSMRLLLWYVWTWSSMRSDRNKWRLLKTLTEQNVELNFSRYLKWREALNLN